GRGELGREPLIKVGTTSQPLGFPAPLARCFLRVQRASGTGRAHGLSIRSASEILHWFKQLSHPHLLRSTAPRPIVSSAPKRSPTSAALHRQKVYLRERQLPGVKSLQSTGGRIMRHPRRIAPALGLLFFVLVVLAIRPAALRAHTVSVAPPDQLGKVNFPTSCVADVQPTIEKGVALLHSFQYKESEQMFTEAAKRDPKC